MIHLRIVAPEGTAHKTLELLCASPSVVNVVHLPGAARKPEGDVSLCDVAREAASVIISDLKELEIPRTGTIAVEHRNRDLRGVREGRGGLTGPAVRCGGLG